MKRPQDLFYAGIVSLLFFRAETMNPEYLAGALYLYLRDHPENLKVSGAWAEILKNVKILLSRECGWDWTEIHTFFAKLKIFTKYMEKST